MALLVLAWLLFQHVSWLNGAYYWRWPWRSLPLTQTLPALALGLIPFVLGVVALELRPRRSVLPLFGAAVSVVALQYLLLGAASDPFSLRRVDEILRSGDATSYLADAWSTRDVPDLLERYPSLMPRFSLHSLTKPPGPIIFYRTLIGLAPDLHAVTTYAAAILALAAAATTPATYLLSRELGVGRSGSTHAAMLAALAPGTLLFFPMFDPAWGALTCLLTITWVRSLRRESVALAVAFGLALAVACFFTYNLLVLGAALAAITWTIGIRQERLLPARVLRLVGAALGAFAVFYLLLWLTTGMNALRVFGVALENQKVLLRHTARPYPATVLFDLLGFAQGAGYLPVFFFVRRLATAPPSSGLNDGSMAWIFGVQLLVVALAGLLPGETERVWLFMVPLVAVEAGRQMAAWPRGNRLIGYASQVAVLAALHANLGVL